MTTVWINLSIDGSIRSSFWWRMSVNTQIYLRLRTYLRFHGKNGSGKESKFHERSLPSLYFEISRNFVDDAFKIQSQQVLKYIVTLWMPNWNCVIQILFRWIYCFNVCKHGLFHEKICDETVESGVKKNIEVRGVRRKKIKSKKSLEPFTTIVFDHHLRSCELWRMYL